MKPQIKECDCGKAMCICHPRVKDCDCEMIECVCSIARKHKDDCKFKKALLCRVGIECDHGYDVCPECDPCSCGFSNPILCDDDEYIKFYRASGNCICNVCGLTYYKHPHDPDVTDWDGNPWLHVLCNGERVKL